MAPKKSSGPSSGGVSRAGVTGTHGSSLRSGRSRSWSAHSPPRSTGPSASVDVVLGDVELTAEQLADLGDHVAVDLEAHGPPEAAPAQLELDGHEEVVGLLLLEREVGVAGDAEGEVVLDLHALEEAVEVGRDDLLERHEPLAVGEHHEPRQRGRHLHPGEAPLLGEPVAHGDREVERQVGDVGEGVAGVDGQRREHREDAVLELLDQHLAVVLVEVVPARQHHAVVGQAGHDLAEEHLLEAGRQLGDPVADREQLLGRRATVGGGAGEPRRDLVLEAGDADLEELVEVLAEDGAELGPLEQRHRRVGRERQDPLVEVEPRELAVEEPLRAVGRGRHHLPVGAREQPGRGRAVARCVLTRKCHPVQGTPGRRRRRRGSPSVHVGFTETTPDPPGRGRPVSVRRARRRRRRRRSRAASR